MQDTLNEQVNKEIYSAYLYLAMQAYFNSLNLKGFANWMHIQTQEELTHTMKFYDYILERGGKVILAVIDGPPSEWETPLAVFENSYKHEVGVSARINELVNLAIEEKDHATNTFLQWFVNEQVEEEASADEVKQKLKLIGSDSSGLFMLDQELAKRIFTPPSA